MPTEPWTKPEGFHYDPESVTPNGDSTKRPSHWQPRAGGQSYPPGYAHDDKGRQICGHWNPNKQRVCRQTDLQPNGRCNWHGGNSPTGEANGQWKGGVSRDRRPHQYRYDPYLPEKLLQRYEEAEEDTELISSRAEMALVTTRIQEVVERLDQGEAGALWLACRDLIKEYRRERDVDVQKAVLDELFDVIQKGAQDYMGWQEIQQLAETRRRLSETEQKRMVNLRQYITAEQATHLVATITGVVLRNVHDPATIARIRDELARVLVSGDDLQVRPAIDAEAIAR